MRLTSLAAVLAPSLLSLVIACGDDGGDDDGGDDGDGGSADAGSGDAGSGLDAGPAKDAGDDGGTDVIFCGGILGLVCEEDQYCDYPDETCGDGDFQGECKQRPTFCDIGGDEVCGCDGQLHMSACAAAMIGVDVAEPVRCGGTVAP